MAPDAWYERPRQVVEHVQEKDAQGRALTREVTRTEIDRIPVPLESSRLRVDLDLDQRYWYDGKLTYESTSST